MSTDYETAEVSAKQRRKERRERRVEQTRRRQQAEQRRRRALLGVLIAAGVVVVLGIAYLVGTTLTTPPPGERVLDQGRDHIARGAPHPPYNSVPPTSGWHWSDAGAPTTPGIHREPVPDEAQIHNLEHGDVMVQYNNLSDAERQRLEDFITRTYPNDPKVVVAPYPNLDKKYALTAWNWIDKFDDYDEGRIRRFINAHKNNGPEFVPNAP